MEILPRKQWNLNPLKTNSRNFSPFFFFFSFFSPGFLYQNSKASRWIHWNPELNRDLVPAVAGQNHNYFKTGKGKKKTPHSAPEPLCFRPLYLETLTLISENLLFFAKSCNLTALSVQMCAPAMCQPPKAPVSITVIQQCRASRTVTARALGSPPEQINIDPLSPGLSEITTCSGGRKCLLFVPAETKFLRILCCLLG